MGIRAQLRYLILNVLLELVLWLGGRRGADWGTCHGTSRPRSLLLLPSFHVCDVLLGEDQLHVALAPSPCLKLKEEVLSREDSVVGGLDCETGRVLGPALAATRLRLRVGLRVVDAQITLGLPILVRGKANSFDCILRDATSVVDEEFQGREQLADRDLVHPECSFHDVHRLVTPFESIDQRVLDAA